MLNVIIKVIDTSSDATIVRDTEGFTRAVNQFIQLPTTLVVSTDVRPIYDGANFFLVGKIDYNIKPTGG